MNTAPPSNSAPSLNNEHWLSAANRFNDTGQTYVLITLLGARGSTPRENGTKMVVSLGEHRELQCYDTIGGGHLEYKVIEKAGELLAQGKAQQHLEHFPLSAKLGQCCGGATSVLFECFTPSAVNIMVFGAGHVGRALIKVLSDLPCRVNWVDERETLFEEQLPANVSAVIEDNPVDAIERMPANSYYIVMTHNHGLDFDLCSALLDRNDARYIGLIGSNTKWQRFQMRFDHRGRHSEDYQRIHCPIGLSQVPGKLPMEVAVSIAGEIINDYQQSAPARQTRRGLQWSELSPVSESIKTPLTHES